MCKPQKQYPYRNEHKEDFSGAVIFLMFALSTYVVGRALMALGVF